MHTQWLGGFADNDIVLPRHPQVNPRERHALWFYEKEGGGDDTRPLLTRGASGAGGEPRKAEVPNGDQEASAQATGPVRTHDLRGQTRRLGTRWFKGE